MITTLSSEDARKGALEQSSVKVPSNEAVTHPLISPSQFVFAVREADNYTDRDAYVSDIALSSVWGDGDCNQSADLLGPSARLPILCDLWDVIHMPVSRIREALGMSRADFAAAFAIPRRTLYRWERDETPCPLCTKLLLAHAAGLYDYPCIRR